MPDATFMTSASEWTHTILIWVGFGTCAGMLAKAIMPGREPGGPIATLLMGIVGTCLGLGVLSYFSSGERITPISPLGFVVGTLGAAVLLFFHRLLGGFLITEAGEGQGGVRGPYYRRGYRRTPRTPTVYEE